MLLWVLNLDSAAGGAAAAAEAPLPQAGLNRRHRHVYAALLALATWSAPALVARGLPWPTV